MKHCIIRSMAREIWGEFLLPFGVLVILVGVLAGLTYGLKCLLDWLGVAEWALPLGALVFAFSGVLFLIVHGLWILYQKAKQNCEGDR